MGKMSRILTILLVTVITILFAVGVYMVIGNIVSQVSQDKKTIEKLESKDTNVGEYTSLVKSLQVCLNSLEQLKSKGDVAGLKMRFTDLAKIIAECKTYKEPKQLEGFYVEIIKIYTAWKTVVTIMENIGNGGDGDITVADKNVEEANTACRKLLEIYNKSLSKDKITK
jgi:hypothetical protein